MPIAILLLAAALCASPLVARPLLMSPPPIVVDVSLTASASPTLVTLMLNEASDIWREAGVTFIWRRAASDAVSHTGVPDRGAYVSSAPRVSVVDDRGRPSPDGLPIGWITFDDRMPGDEIFVSYANAQFLLARTPGAFGAIDRMPRREQETYLGRALGRGLAHELGHYLLGSKAHSQSGLMQAKRSSAEFFSGYRNHFSIDAAQQQAIVARLTMLAPFARDAEPEMKMP